MKPLSGRIGTESVLDKYAYVSGATPTTYTYPGPNQALAITKKQKVAKQQLVDADRQTCWTTHYGRNKKSAVCLFCNRTELHKSIIANWHAGHLIVRTLCDDPRSYLYLAPICTSCNSSMSTQNAFDYLLENHRVSSLKTICFNIFEAWKGSAETDASVYDHMAWRFVKDTYGPQVKGGISTENANVIYKVLAAHQLQLVGNEVAALMQDVQEKSRLMERLAGASHRPAKRARDSDD
jgi:hypothetical protein